MANFFDVYGCPLCEREVITEAGPKKEYVCCDLPMRLVKGNTEFEKVDSTEWPAEKLTAVLQEETGFAESNSVSKILIGTPTVEVKMLGFKSGQETTYEKARFDLTLFVVEGTGSLALGYEDVELAQSTVVVVPKGMLWGIKNTGSSFMTVLQIVNKSR